MLSTTAKLLFCLSATYAESRNVSTEEGAEFNEKRNKYFIKTTLQTLKMPFMAWINKAIFTIDESAFFIKKWCPNLMWYPWHENDKNNRAFAWLYILWEVKNCRWTIWFWKQLYRLCDREILREWNNKSPKVWICCVGCLIYYI